MTSAQSKRLKSGPTKVPYDEWSHRGRISERVVCPVYWGHRVPIHRGAL